MDKIRIGLIGCGGFMRYRLGNLKQVEGVEIAALTEPAEEQVRLTLRQHPDLAGVPVYRDADEMMDKERLDAVSIATPHTQHAGQILAAFAHGLHVCCEKPLVTTVKDAHRVIAARDQAGKVGMVSYQRHFQAEFRFIRERILSGEAGEVTYIQATLTQDWLRLTRGTWRQQMALSGGGMLNDSGSHMLDVVLWVSGASAATVTAFSDDKGTEVDIDTAMSVRFKNGAMANFAIVGDGLAWHEDITFWCEKMTFFLRQNEGLSTTDPARNRFRALDVTGGSSPDQNFIDAVRGKADCESPFECGLEVARLTEAAMASAARGGVPIDVVL